MKYKISRSNWNPLGSGHLYFENTTVTSLCIKSHNCSTSASIVGETVRGGYLHYKWVRFDN